MSLLENAKALAPGLEAAILRPEEKQMSNLLENCKRLDYSPDQPREENGQFGEGSGSSGARKPERIVSRSALEKGEFALTINERGEIWAQSVKKNGQLSDSSSKLSQETADEWLAEGSAAYIADKRVPSETKPAVRNPYAGLTREQTIQKMADEGKPISQKDWDYAMNRDM